MTEPLAWSETFSVGHQGLDAEHRQMVDLINQVCLACDPSQGARQPPTLLRELESLTETHFEHEEAVLEELYTTMSTDRRNLREILAAAKVEHATEHRSRLSDLREISRTLRCDELAVSKLCERLKAWFIDQAVGYEAQMKTIIQSV